MKLKALRALRYASKSVPKGSVFEAKDGDVRVLVGAKIAEHYVAPVVPRVRAAVLEAPVERGEPESVLSDGTVVYQPKRYKRRDLTAE